MNKYIIILLLSISFSQSIESVDWWSNESVDWWSKKSNTQITPSSKKYEKHRTKAIRPYNKPKTFTEVLEVSERQEFFKFHSVVKALRLNAINNNPELYENKNYKELVNFFLKF